MKQKTQAFLETRKRLQILHKQRQSTTTKPSKNQHADSTPNGYPRVPTAEDQDEIGDLDDLVEYIENSNDGFDCGEGASCSDPKKAAKKARQKQRKLAEKHDEEERARLEDEAEEKASRAASAQPHMPPASHQQPMYPNHPNPHMMWMYGYPPPPPPPMAPYGMNYPGMGYPPPPPHHAPPPPPSLQPLHQSFPTSGYGYPPYGSGETADWGGQMKPNILSNDFDKPMRNGPYEPSRPSPISPPTSSSIGSKSGSVAGLMEGFMKKQTSSSVAAAGSKMVTIRRVMEPHSSDPTVTISMKGDTPDKDKLMFTLVNGQVIPSSDVLKEGFNEDSNDNGNEGKKKKKRKKKKNGNNSAAMDTNHDDQFEAHQSAPIQRCQPLPKPSPPPHEAPKSNVSEASMNAKKHAQSPNFDPATKPTPMRASTSPPAAPKSDKAIPMQVASEPVQAQSLLPDSKEILPKEEPSVSPEPVMSISESSSEPTDEINDAQVLPEIKPTSKMEVEEEEDDDKFEDAKEAHDDSTSSVTVTNEVVETLARDLESSLDLGELSAMKSGAQAVEKNLLSSLPDILEDGHNVDLLEATIAQLRRLMAARNSGDDAAALNEKDKELLETGKSLEALVQKMRQVRKGGGDTGVVEEEYGEEEGGEHGEECLTCPNCKGCVEEVPEDEEKHAEEGCGKKKELVEEEEEDEEDDKNGEDLLKNLKLPPDITITRIKSADGRKSFNFKRSNPNQSLLPIKSPVSSAPPTSRAAMDPRDRSSPSSMASSQHQQSWNKNVIVLDSQQQKDQSSLPRRVSYPSESSSASVLSPFSMASALPRQDHLDRVAGGLMSSGSYMNPSLGRRMHPPPPPPPPASVPGYWHPSMYGYNPGPVMPPPPHPPHPNYQPGPYGYYPQMGMPHPPPPPMAQQPPLPAQSQQQGGKNSENKGADNKKKGKGKKGKQQNKGSDKTREASQDQQQQVPPPPPHGWPPQVPGWVYYPHPHAPQQQQQHHHKGAEGGNSKTNAPGGPEMPPYPYCYGYMMDQNGAHPPPHMFYPGGMPPYPPPNTAPHQQQDHEQQKPSDVHSSGGSKSEGKPAEQSKSKGKADSKTQSQQKSNTQPGKKAGKAQVPQKADNAAGKKPVAKGKAEASQENSFAHLMRDGSRVPLPISDALPQQQQQGASGATGPAQPASKRAKKNKKNARGRKADDIGPCESVFVPKNVDLEDETLDETEKELEAFKRFCFASVPRDRKEKVNLNIRDIIMKKRGENAAAQQSNQPGSKRNS